MYWREVKSGSIHVSVGYIGGSFYLWISLIAIILIALALRCYVGGELTIFSLHFPQFHQRLRA
jgi:hypothetical protein